MNKIVLIVCITFSAIISAQSIDPDLDLTEFWEFGEEDQNQSIDISITQFAQLVRNNGGTFTPDYSHKSDAERISDMKSCMRTFGISSGSVGESYILCIRNLRWITGVN